MTPLHLVSLSENLRAIYSACDGNFTLGTACSGTDLVVVVWKSIFDACANRFGDRMTLFHAYSCENVEFKQHFISTFHSGAKLFGDIVDLKELQAKTVATELEDSEMIPVPKAFAIVFGVECDSISSCNKNRSDNFSTLDDHTPSATGRSGEALAPPFPFWKPGPRSMCQEVLLVCVCVSVGQSRNPRNASLVAVSRHFSLSACPSLPILPSPRRHCQCSPGACTSPIPGDTTRAALKTVETHNPAIFWLECVKNLQTKGKSGKSVLDGVVELANNQGYHVVPSMIHAEKYGSVASRERWYLTCVKVPLSETFGLM